MLEGQPVGKNALNNQDKKPINESDSNAQRVPMGGAAEGRSPQDAQALDLSPEAMGSVPNSTDGKPVDSKSPEALQPGQEGSAPSDSAKPQNTRDVKTGKDGEPLHGGPNADLASTNKNAPNSSGEPAG